jgi:outer membrane scaffolding protein for murein synthesis (MipA/OmpV family)
VLVFGGLLFGITAATWVLYVINKSESMAAAGIFVGGFWSFVVALAGFSLEVGVLDTPKYQASSHYRTVAGPQGNEDSGQERRRAW